MSSSVQLADGKCLIYGDFQQPDAQIIYCACTPLSGQLMVTCMWQWWPCDTVTLPPTTNIIISSCCYTGPGHAALAGTNCPPLRIMADIYTRGGHITSHHTLALHWRAPRCDSCSARVSRTRVLFWGLDILRLLVPRSSWCLLCGGGGRVTLTHIQSAAQHGWLSQLCKYDTAQIDVSTRAVYEPSHSFTVPGEGSYYSVQLRQWRKDDDQRAVCLAKILEATCWLCSLCQCQHRID